MFQNRNLHAETRDVIDLTITRDARPVNLDAHASGFARHERAITVAGSDAEGGPLISTDLPGGRVSVSQNPDGSVSVTEFSQDDVAGETITIPTIAAPLEE